MNDQEEFSGFSFEELCAFVRSLDAISSPTDHETYRDADEIMLENMPEELPEATKEWATKRIGETRDQMKPEFGNYDQAITPQSLEDNIKVTLARNVKTKTIAGTFRDGIGSSEGSRIRITLNPNPDFYTTQEVLEVLIHEYTHASSFIRGENNKDDSNDFGTRCLNAFVEWNERATEITGLTPDDPALKDLTARVFGTARVYEGPIGKVSDKIATRLVKAELQQRMAENPYAMERKKAFPRGVPTLHKGIFDSYRTNDQRYYCQKEGREWVLSDKEEPGVESYFKTLTEAKGHVEENYLREWREKQALKPTLETAPSLDEKPQIDLDEDISLDDIAQSLGLDPPSAPKL